MTWDPEQQEAFDNSEQALQQSKMLTYIDPTKQLRLERDAPPYGIRAVLSHSVRNIDKPIVFRSRRLSKAERNYIQLARELLAFGVSRFRDSLLGRSFIFVTGPTPLVGLFCEDRPIPVMAAARIQL